MYVRSSIYTLYIPALFKRLENKIRKEARKINEGKFSRCASPFVPIRSDPVSIETRMMNIYRDSGDLQSKYLVSSI